MSFAHLDNSGRLKRLTVVGRAGCMVDMKLEVEERKRLDLVRMPANLCPDKSFLVDRNLVGIVLLGSLDCMTTKANLVAAKSHCHRGGRGRFGVVENCHRLNGDHSGADCFQCFQEKDLDAIVPSLWFALHLGFH